MILALAAGAAALWTAYSYRSSKRAEAARWMVQLFRDFYGDVQMSSARERLEYGFFSEMAPILEMRVLDRGVGLSDDERAALRDVDLVLNFLEQLLFLQAEGHVKDRDRRVFFEYWFDQLELEDHAAARRYLANCGYEYCSRHLELATAEYFAAYGSLMTGEGGPREKALRSRMIPRGGCEISGQLYSRGEFPALVRGEGVVCGELFLVPEAATFRELDAIEHYDPENRAKSLYRRRCVSVTCDGHGGGRIDAWIYLWNGATSDLEPIPQGDWKRVGAADT
ncbi:MAG: gamma-glutamylcyclotransferase family protein [Solirubrobacteraceae bacterium]